MWDSIFCLIHHLDKPYKKKDIHYLINYRLSNKKKNSIIIAHDININDKCNDCKEFQPWVLLKNSGEGCFLLKKIVEKTTPWNSCFIQENIYDLDKIEPTNDGIFVLITNIKSNQNINPLERLYGLSKDFQNSIIDADIRIKNQCFNCEFISPWFIIKNDNTGIEFARHLTKNYQPFIILKRQKTIYEHNIPKIIRGLEKWTLKEQMRYGNMMIQLQE